MPERETHQSDMERALHILLVVAMHRLGVERLEVTEVDYAVADAAYSDLRLKFDGTTYTAERKNYDTRETS